MRGAGSVISVADHYFPIPRRSFSSLYDDQKDNATLALYRNMSKSSADILLWRSTPSAARGVRYEHSAHRCHWYQAVAPVLIIGAGAGGASTAYYLGKIAGNAGKEVDITIYERSNYVGGRSTTVNVLDDKRYPVELGYPRTCKSDLGASIFVRENPILYNATLDFGLELESMRVVPVAEDEDSLGMCAQKGLG
jgi:NAD(P)-binding Rossmann-like domain